MSSTGKFRVPEIILGALLSVAIFGLGALSTGEHRASGNLPQTNFSQTTQKLEEPAAFTRAWWLKDATGYLTIFLVFIGVVQAGLFFWQLILMRRSVQDAGKAASSAALAATAAQKELQFAYRPFVGVDRVDVRSFKSASGSASIDLSVVLKNGGTFPARGLKLFPKLMIGDLPTCGREVAKSLDDDFTNETPSFRKSLMEGDMILPHGSTFVQPVVLSTPVAEADTDRAAWIMIALAYWGQERHDHDQTPKPYLGTFAYEVVPGPQCRLVPLYGFGSGTT